MWILIAGILLLWVVLGVFHLKDRFHNPWLARLAYHELTMRLTVVAAALIFFGAITAVGDFLGPPPSRR
ncbi:MAG: hypothetical protein CMM60_07400 [Rhodospirillaceae bacterium]|jgi:hypothetical protein|nr:hypothetical protein [Rhodospirillaceae bacterium]|tara:strand:+ start:1110 stop:1316 length:207 start_codon:yes stop_codon:yes gene_type:complete